MRLTIAPMTFSWYTQGDSSKTHMHISSFSEKRLLSFSGSPEGIHAEGDERNRDLPDRDTPRVEHRAPNAGERTSAETRIRVAEDDQTNTKLNDSVPTISNDAENIPVRRARGLEYIRRLNPNVNGDPENDGYFTKQYGLWTNRYLYMKFNAAAGLWQVSIGNATEWRDPGLWNQAIRRVNTNYITICSRLAEINSNIDINPQRYDERHP